jgi:hypothetical protein
VSDNLVQLNVAQGSFLATISLYRMPDESIRAALEDMPPHVIESKDTITARFTLAAAWMGEAACDLLRQANRFDPENRDD